jgi:hypothetical protein
MTPKPDLAWHSLSSQGGSKEDITSEPWTPEASQREQNTTFFRALTLIFLFSSKKKKAKYS